MSIPVYTSAAAATAALEAAGRRREEEEMTAYNRSDLEGWEFKIVRSALGRFANRRTIERVRREEAESGWELVEKFDDQRLRFKRRVERRASDHVAKTDPYRTSIGLGGAGSSGAIILGVVLLLAGVAAFLFLNH